MRKLITTFVATAVATMTYAGGVNTNTNQHAAYHRNFAREATTDIDAAYSNPAGTVFMSDGFHISFSGQAAFQDRDIKSTYKPFSANSAADTNGTKSFNGEAIAPFVPSLQAVYKKNNWAAYLNLSVPGGGGKATFEDGIPLFEKQVASIPLSLSAAGIPTNSYSMNSYIKGQQFIIGATIGGAYKFSEHLSASLGLRFCYALNTYEGYVRDITINPNGNEIAANTYFKAAQADYADKASKASAAAKQYEDAGMTAEATQMKTAAAQATAAATKMGESAAATEDKELDCTQTGWGLSPIIGIDYKYGPVTLATRYEFKTKITVKNDTKVDGTGMYQDGVEDRDDMPAMWTFGMDCQMSEKVKLCTGYRYYFDKDAHYLGGAEKYIEHGTKEYAFGVEWDAISWLMLSCGYLRTQFYFADDYFNNINYNNGSNNFGLGGRFTINKNLQVQVSGFFSKYDSRDVTKQDYAGIGISGKDHYERSNVACAFSIDYHF